LKKIIWLAVNLIISGVCIWLATRGIEWDELAASFVHLNIFFIILSVLSNWLSCWLRAVRLRYMMNPIKTIPTSHLFSSLMAGFMVNNIMPFRLGEFLRAYVIKKNDGVSFTTSMGIIVVERLLDVLSLLLIFGVLTFFFPFPEWVKNGGMLVLAIVVLSIGFLYLMIWKTNATMQVLNKCLQPFSNKLTGKLEHIIRSFTVGINFIHGLSAYIMISILTLLIWAAYIYAVLAMMHAMNFDTIYDLGFFSATVVMVFTCFAIMIPAAPGYVGTFHQIGKQSLMLFQVDDGHALGYVIVFHAVHYVAVTGLGLFYFLKNNLTLREAIHSSDTIGETTA